MDSRVEDHEKYMWRCLQIADYARGNTSPNPMVGAVIVHNGVIISEGYHHRAGEPHAEPNAINAVRDKELLKQAILYVSLEPCSHYGKTPPCAELIISVGIRRVVIGMLDPNPIVAGRGVKMLQDAGVEVITGVLQTECLELNKRFVCFHTKHRPYIMLKWAQTSDGFIDYTRVEKGAGPLRISNEITKTLNHQVRVCEDAILVGTTTALLDDPHLTSRKWGNKNPMRCVLDLRGRLPISLQLWNDEARTIAFVGNGVIPSYAERASVELVHIDLQAPLVPQILFALYDRQIQSLIVEGGTKTIYNFVEENLWDEARVEISPSLISSGVVAPQLGIERSNTIYYYENRIDHYQNKKAP